MGEQHWEILLMDSSQGNGSHWCDSRIKGKYCGMCYPRMMLDLGHKRQITLANSTLLTDPECSIQAWKTDLGEDIGYWK